MNKLKNLADIEGLEVEEMIEEYAFDEVVPGICSNPDCDYSTHVEPDSTDGWCEECQTNTVCSCLILAGLI